MKSVKDAVKDRQKRGKTPQKIRYDSYNGSLFDGKYSQGGSRFLPIIEVYLEPSQKFTMKSSIVNDQLGSKYTSALAYY